jgi:hypothetical protein
MSERLQPRGDRPLVERIDDANPPRRRGAPPGRRTDDHLLEERRD